MGKSLRAELTALDIGQSEQGQHARTLPDYLKRTYWWAYLHPRAVRIFERQWLVNLILWGNFDRLRRAALDEIGEHAISGENLQIACVYGNLSSEFAGRMDKDARLHLVDVADIQLQNAAKKLAGYSNVSLHRQDSARLQFEDGRFDNVVVFFLLHEQPETVRRATIAEALRVTRNGGKLVFVDYHKPGRWNPFRYLMHGVFRLLEPYAHDFWRKDIQDWAPAATEGHAVSKQLYFGGLYQKTTMIRR